MMYVLIVSGLLVVFYCTIILLYNHWFKKLLVYKPATSATDVAFSVIIPARNEENNIGNCIQSILENNYPNDLLEIIVIDDYSTDNTLSIIKDWQTKSKCVRFIEMKDLISEDEKINSYKKLAIQKAVERAGGTYIITTDADCIVPQKWLHNFNAFIQEKGAYFIAAPVRFINDGSFLSVFQCLDFLSLQGITAASVSAGFHSMCNGANLCYKKDIFFEVGGFKGFEHLASGDDMFLMRKIQKKYPDKTQYIFSQDSIVSTLPMPTVKSFFNQRIRWASKADRYDDKRIIAVLFLVYFTNLVFPLLFILGFFNVQYFLWLLIFYVFKVAIEMIFMRNVCKFFQQSALLKYFPFMEAFHIVYTLISGWLGKFGKYEWKGRSVQ